MTLDDLAGGLRLGSDRIDGQEPQAQGGKSHAHEGLKTGQAQQLRSIAVQSNATMSVATAATAMARSITRHAWC